MRTSTLCLSFGFAVACLVAGCDDEVAGPYQDVTLSVTPESFAIDTPLVGPAPSATVAFANTGDRATTVRLCNLPAPNPPGAQLVLQEQAPDSSWQNVVPWTTCVDPSNGFDQSVGPGSEVQVGRLYPANHTGRFRYQMKYAVSDGSVGTATSAPFTVDFM